jgi:hypothetical protein
VRVVRWFLRPRCTALPPGAALRLRGPLGGETIIVPGGLAHSNKHPGAPRVGTTGSYWPRRTPTASGPAIALPSIGYLRAECGPLVGGARSFTPAGRTVIVGPALLTLLSRGRPSALGRVTPCLLDGSIQVKRALLFTYFSQVPRLFLIAGRAP